MLKVENLAVSYGQIQALKGISFQIRPGEIVTLIGSNGAGKTTTLKALSGLLKIGSGRVLLEDRDLNKIPAHEIARLGLVHVPEGRGIFAPLTVKENLEMGGYLKKKPEIERGIEEVFAIFPRLKERHKQKAGTLSGGEQQMLAIGRALISEPRVLLLDEPSLGLAPVIVQSIFAVIQKLNHEKRLPILLVEQNARMALSISHRGYILETGKIIREDSAARLIHDDEVKKAYLGG